MEEAVRRQPQSGLAWSRLAELRQMTGDLDGALDAARRAADLRPQLAHVQTVLGFSHLSRIELEEARKAFETAIRLEPGSPLPRLGLGLATIRGGHLEAGRGEIEIAASLDPGNALIRSYLGKAYYEEKRDGLAAAQLAEAKQLDPGDPTPWFYDAIRKQSVNRPVEALGDLKKSIALNDNRAVYRSRLLLDEDLAARSATLGRIYSDLGFQQLALVEGWKSLNTDPGNFSAHRFLADSYSALPRHEIARVSELLQSQLLQPVNITPIQPRLAETHLPLVSAQGPESLSFNTYNPLFERDRATLLVSGLGGENETRGGEAVAAGIYRKLSLSAAYSHAETGGWRENSDVRDDLADLFAQVSLSPRTSVQGEYRYRDENAGDTTRRFEEDDFSSSLRKDEEAKIYRLGLRHALRPDSDILVSAIYQDADYRQHRLIPTPPGVTAVSEIDTATDGYTAEAQHQLRRERFSLISGAGHFEADRKDVGSDAVTVSLPFPPFAVTNEERAVTRSDLRHSNLYLYSQTTFPESVAWTLGASGDFFDGGLLDLDRDRINPKLGLIWDVDPRTTVRAAAFRTLKRTLISDQTLEPTQVAGFNQFFDDVEGTEAWRWGLAVDQKVSAALFGGVELSRRELEVSFFDTDSRAAQDAEWEENLIRVYFFWSPHDWVSLSAEYQYECFERDIEAVGVEQFDDLKTHRFPLGANFFHPSGFKARLGASYVDQSGVFVDPTSEMRTKDDDRFWVVDASMGYRLPDRMGIFSVEAKNLFNEGFNYLDMDPAHPVFYPERLILARFTLTF